MSKKTYINIGGSHFQDGVEFLTGAKITTEKNLAKAFPEKFKVHLTEPAAKEDNEKDEGEDLTSDFLLAEENGLVVTKEGKFYTVTEEGEILETEKPLTSKAAVTAFIQEYTEE